MGMKNSCPLCRSSFPEDFTPLVDFRIQDSLNVKYAQEFNDRKSELIS
jgi:hypothetical protein